MAKSKDFLNFCDNLLDIIDKTPNLEYNLSKPDSSDGKASDLEKFMDSHHYDKDNTILEAQKLLTANVQENCSLSLLKTFYSERQNLDDSVDNKIGVIGYYLHSKFRDNLGKTGSIVDLESTPSTNQTTNLVSFFL